MTLFLCVSCYCLTKAGIQSSFVSPFVYGLMATRAVREYENTVYLFIYFIYFLFLFIYFILFYFFFCQKSLETI